MAEQITEDAWLYYNPPEGEARIDVPVTLILEKPQYERFMALIQNDAELFRDVVSSLIAAKMEDWTGRYAGVSEPEVVADIVQAALDKHKPLKVKA